MLANVCICLFTQWVYVSLTEYHTLPSWRTWASNLGGSNILIVFNPESAYITWRSRLENRKLWILLPGGVNCMTTWASTGVKVLKNKSKTIKRNTLTNIVFNRSTLNKIKNSIKSDSFPFPMLSWLRCLHIPLKTSAGNKQTIFIR